MRLTKLLLPGMLLVGAPLCARADALFEFTIIGDGHTFQFTTPNPPFVYNHPHSIDTPLRPVAGTVDGIGGYTFSGSVTVFDSGEPSLEFSVSPLPPDTPTNPTSPYRTGYALYSLPFTTLISDVPNPDPLCYIDGGCGDLLTYAYAPGDYTGYGLGPNLDGSSYILEIAAVPSAAATPEPGSWVLELTGAFGLVLLSQTRFKKVRP